MHRIHQATFVIAAAVGIAASIGPANAVVQCKSTATAGIGVTSTAAETAWRNAATTSYGAAWANLSLATGRQYQQVGAPPIGYYILSAYPCANVVINPQIFKAPLFPLTKQP